MKGFKKWITEDEDVKSTISKLPAKHQKLIKGYKIVFEPRNTLHGDEGHVGMVVNKPKKLIRVASPWNYGREFALIHEIAHLVYAVYMTPELKKEWEKITKKTKNKKKDENPEELWCHNYANYFAKNKIVIHTHPEWARFLKKFIDE
jgi:hypothetical protein